ncbi:DNA-processing protein DprA [Paenibacillus sp.]|uniref:DNA-processing protein DprA n=1 Tax=Paenibacillus sp. TaxID=58172 RepID=UPI0035694664
MNNRHLLFALHQLPGIGWKTIQRLVSRFETLDDMRTLEPREWTQFGFTPGRAGQMSSALRELSERTLEDWLARYEREGIRWLTVWDADYPALLKETADPPWIIYGKGDFSLSGRLCIALVGTRTPTVYGKLTAERLGESLANAGVCVVSGMARGIDSLSHEGALRGKGGTIAVLGCGLDTVYPPENKALFHRVAEQGLLLSEYPLGTLPRAGLFPQRNRIIAGLSVGVVVVEAALQSGSLITANLALDYSRDVFAIPGPIHSAKSQGTLKLIKDGAKMVTSPDDIMEEYASRIASEHSAYIKDTKETLGIMAEDERKIYELLESGPKTIDQLLGQSQFTFGHLHAVLINLLMMRRIVELPGSAYTIP